MQRRYVFGSDADRFGIVAAEPARLFDCPAKEAPVVGRTLPMKVSNAAPRDAGPAIHVRMVDDLGSLSRAFKYGGPVRCVCLVAKHQKCVISSTKNSSNVSTTRDIILASIY